MATPDSKRPALDANGVVAIIEGNWVRWGWDEKHSMTMIGKLSRGPRASRLAAHVDRPRVSGKAQAAGVLVGALPSRNRDDRRPGY